MNHPFRGAGGPVQVDIDVEAAIGCNQHDWNASHPSYPVEEQWRL